MSLLRNPRTISTFVVPWIVLCFFDDLRPEPNREERRTGGFAAMRSRHRMTTLRQQRNLRLPIRLEAAQFA
jgi:hypothetical protein